jgi:hypothetical protein
MVKVEGTRVYEVTTTEMWGTIGDFHRAHAWHPGIADSKPSEDGKTRTLTLAGDAGTVVETQTDEGDLHYSYRIDESPLPVKDYEATLMVREAGDGSEVVWSAQFMVDGATEEQAAKIVQGVIDGGLDSL